MKPNRSVKTVLLCAIFGAASVFYMVALKPSRFGAYHDDAIYVSTARALANGEGYRLINLPDVPAQTKYPPLYPFILSLIWKTYPDFPTNVNAMMLLSVILTLGFLAATWRFLVENGYATTGQALLIVAMTALNWRTMILATSVYSEMLFSLLAVAGLHLAEESGERSKSWVRGLALGAVIGLTCLTRSSGISLLVSVAVYYALRKEWRRAVVPVTVASLFVVGWIAWSSSNRTDAQFANVAYYTSYVGHLNQVVGDIQAQSESSRLAVFLNIAVENFVGGILISVPLISSGLSYKSFSGLNGYVLVAALCGAFLFLLLITMSFIRSLAERVRLLHIYIVASLGLYLFWLPGVSYDRFLMPLLPFLLVFLVSELSRLVRTARKGLVSAAPALRISGALIAIVSLAVASMSIYGYASGAVYSIRSLDDSAARHREDAMAIDWITKHTEPSDVLACYRDPKYFLYTGRKAVRSFPMTEGFSWEEDEGSMQKLTPEIFRIIEEANARYLVVTSSDFELEDRPEQHRNTFDKLIDQHRGNFVLVFESPDSGTRIYRIAIQQSAS